MRKRTIAAIGSLLVAFAAVAMPTRAVAQIAVGISVGFAPPDLPVYEQPICPGDDYIWTPGYWAWDNSYYWVPGTWVLAPEPGYLWTPPYWGWNGGAFVFYDGYWGPHVGFYGGVNYGFGYGGHGFEGGRWDNGHFFYNRSVSNVNVTVIHNVYNTTIVNNNVTRVSYNGGNGGINARATTDEEGYAHERHIAPVAEQTAHIQAARGNTELRATANHGQPQIAATPRPGAFSDHGVVHATEAGTVHGPAGGGGGGAPMNTAIHPKELPAIQRPAAPNTGNPQLDQKYQQQQDKLVAQQNADRLKLQAKQDQEHQTLTAKGGGAAAEQQALEQKHQQQTQAMVQKHTQQTQKLQTRQAPRPSGGGGGGGGSEKR